MNFIYYLKTHWWHWLVSKPFGASLYVGVKRLLGQYPKKANVSDGRFQCAESFRDTYLQYGSKPIEKAVCYEFGAGYELFITMCLASFGFRTIHTVDRVQWACPDSLNYAAQNVQQRTKFPEAIAPPFTQSNYIQVLSDYYRIDYQAPADARNTSLADNSIDYIFSNAVLEHIPMEELKPILKECHRLLAADGLVMFTVGYMDHCFNRTVSPCYFYRFPEKEWKKMYPPDGHNRLRHSDYKKLFEEAGFDVVSSTAISPLYEDTYKPERFAGWTAQQLIDEIKTMPIDPEFTHYSLEDMATLCGFWVLKKRD